jgi:hypothetical protein
MARKASLNAALDDVTPPPAAPVRYQEPQPTKTPVVPSREGTALIGAHLPARYGKAMKLLSAQTGQTQRELFEEALNMLFVKKGARELGVDL